MKALVPLIFFLGLSFVPEVTRSDLRQQYSGKNCVSFYEMSEFYDLCVDGNRNVYEFSINRRNKTSRVGKIGEKEFEASSNYYGISASLTQYNIEEGKLVRYTCSAKSLECSSALERTTYDPVDFQARQRARETERANKEALKRRQIEREERKRAGKAKQREFLAFLNSGISRHGSGDYQEAVSFYGKAIAIYPQSFDAYNKRGISRFSLKDYQGAIRDYGKAIEINQRNSKIYFNRGLAKFSIQDYQGATADFSKSIEIEPEAFFYNSRCYSRFKLKDYSNALSDCNKSVSIDSKLVYGYDTRAKVKMALSDSRGACSDWRKARRLGYKNNKQNQIILDNNFKKNCR